MESGSPDLTDGVIHLSGLERLRRTVVLGLVVALAAAFAPIIVVVTAVLAVLLGLGTLLALGSWRIAGWFVVCGLGGALVGALLNVPWFETWSWS